MSPGGSGGAATPGSLTSLCAAQVCRRACLKKHRQNKEKLVPAVARFKRRKVDELYAEVQGMHASNASCPARQPALVLAP